MGWHCPKCNFMVEDGAFQCMACGYHQETRLILTSGVGNKWRTLISAEITRRTYKRLYPDTEHQYIPRNEGEHPFSVIKVRHIVALCRSILPTARIGAFGCT